MEGIVGRRGCKPVVVIGGEPGAMQEMDFRELRYGEVRSIELLGTQAKLFYSATPTQTRAHRSHSQCQRISLRYLLYPATICSTPMPRTRLWDSLLLTNPPTRTPRSSSFCRICR